MSVSTFLVRIALLLVFVIGIDVYAFRAFRLAMTSIPSERLQQIAAQLYIAVSAIFIIGVIIALSQFKKFTPPNRTYLALIMGGFILLYVPKLILVIVLLIEDILRLLRAGGVGIGKLTGHAFDNTPYFEGRRQFFSQAALLLAAIPFVSTIYGLYKGRYRFTVHKVTLQFKNLPKAFDGLTITQLSDMHMGSFDNPTEVKKGIDLVNAQQSDLLLFTGDIVNNMAVELEPWMDQLKQLKSKMGSYSILGNHDYGDYMEWPSIAQKQANLDRLKTMHKEIGFKLLLNESIALEKNGEKIYLVGMENWGNGSFAKYGDLNKSLSGVPAEQFKILMSHDPSHWDAQTLHHPTPVELTLAGHTHGMQFGIEIPGFQWSPVKYRYPRWAGLYTEGKQHLYVNRGFGYIGFPGRVGIWPEITVITLRSLT